MAILCWCVLVFALAPALLFVWNLALYMRPHEARAHPIPLSVSILIPARNEEASIERCVRAALASLHADLEVIVLDDHSTDRTRAIVEALHHADGRVRVVSGEALPPGWCGKQFACWTLASVATKPHLCFVDADVRLQPHAIASLCTEMQRLRVPLVSGFPHQDVETAAEQLLIPLMHFILLGFLPLFFMQRNANPAYAAGCGQLFVANREAYFKAGGHESIKDSRHDGLTLPRSFRRAGFRTGLCDATNLADCRMYHNASEVFSGLLKNATEGLASPHRIVPFTVILFVGQVLPLLLAPWSRIALLALLLSVGTRVTAAARFRQPLLAALCHPISIAMLLALQWIALVRSMLGVPSQWKGRSYSTT